LRVCLVYDCLYPHTVGGGERWYRNLAERLAQAGHEVTYLTLRQWDHGTDPGVEGVNVVVVGPRMALYSGPGQRRILPPLVFGAGVLWHLLRRGRRYDVVHTSSFPYFSLLAAALMRPLGRYRVVTDWFEVWTREYWREYLGTAAGTVGWLIQRMCARVPQRAFCLSRLHARRLAAEGLRGEVTVLSGIYDGPMQPLSLREPDPVVAFVGRLIPEKQALTVVDAMAAVRRRGADLRGVVVGDGPELERVRARIAELGLERVVDAPGFVAWGEVEALLAGALCLLSPSRREGYGLVVIEAAQAGTPSIVVAAPDNAAVELIEPGENGFVAASTDPEELASLILSVAAGGIELRRRTAAWFADNARRVSLAQSLDQVVAAYAVSVR
jgi:glycosyltransferase involved in cell wall biosynthesis